MAKAAPPSMKVKGLYTEDLSEWVDVEEVPALIRDLPAMYGIRENDPIWGPGAVALREMLKSDDKAEFQKATQMSQRAYYFLINLMRVSSGLEVTSQSVSEWSMEELEGKNVRGQVNFGNVRQRSSRNADSNPRYANANDSEPGVYFRMLSYKDNFYVALESLRFYMGGEPDTTGKARHEAGKKVLAFVQSA